MQHPFVYSLKLIFFIYFPVFPEVEGSLSSSIWGTSDTLIYIDDYFERDLLVAALNQTYLHDIL